MDRWDCRKCCGTPEPRCRKCYVIAYVEDESPPPKDDEEIIDLILAPEGEE